ncbi:MAG TPA: choice-of-anchor Q domain-containing protein [Terriglobia bacterium]|nr:choice-of-anchor Q domain-containing protein [Terriglobia bacterium]
MRSKYTLLLFVLALSFAAAAPAATWYVNGKTGRDTNNCTSAKTACKTIGHAISLAASGDSISVAAATYTENLTITVNLSLIGANASTTIVDGGAVSRVISILSTTARVSLSRLTIRDGIAAGGGGILNWGKLTVSSSTISGNTASSSYSATGGGIYNSGTLTVNSSTLNANTGTTTFMYGGAIYNSGTVAINNSTISGNSALGFTGGGGGGIYNSAGTVTINNSTLSGNSGTPDGGGIYNGATTILQNSIVASSTSGGNCSGAVTSHGYNLSSDGTCNFNSAGDLNNTDPQLGSLQNNGGQTQTMALPSGSPAIDAGNPAGCTDNTGRLLKTDQRGQPRPDSEDTGGCDMGAYESQTD